MTAATKLPISVCVAGVSGEVGRLLAKSILEQDDLRLTSAVARSASGRTVGALLGCDCDLDIRPSLAEALERDRFDVLVDYTSANVAYANVRAGLEAGIPVVVGTSGITAEEFEQLDRLARDKKIGAIHGNFAITATLAQIFAADAANHLKSWEIIEFAHDGKIDAVSATARELANRLAERGGPERKLALDAFVGDNRSRGATIEGTQVHALRLPGMVAGFEIIFGRGHERLTIRHEALTRAEPYIGGTLLAIRKAPQLIGVHRGLESVLALN
ncbi:4-hydroxy-tetrahydrodipicolinate reductase [Sphingosinicella rhizophila]|uniref:4-hydroxy-tetrahydrodipicolinate reductase n=1 Tax=Sphingosinicella rhizophila TaxID=3050082 RepID=A0ABU3Q5Z9_9SPHN|nr:4-hydroxy-tetrahydrodipicolinate reductase [Sphingosinicella sp. GR2756]MDT9598727.1 4-hydroxy-tetrahydrodipicolinate reductase [Sphingosinicella sp. GR2756]